MSSASGIIVLLKNASQNIESLTKIKLKTPQEITHTLTIFLEYGIMAYNYDG